MAKSYPAKGILNSGQSSLEYLLVVALSFIIIVPTAYLFYNYSKESSEEITDAQITKLGRSIVDSAELIFYSGQGSKTTLQVSVPSGVTSVQIIDGIELVFNATTSIGISELVFFSNVNLTTAALNCNGNVCQIPGLAIPGSKRVKVEAMQDYVSIETV